jgi:hypothetical protein
LDETDIDIAVKMVIVVAGDIGVQLHYVFIPCQFTTGIARSYVFLPYFADIRDYKSQRQKIHQFQNDGHVDVYGIGIAESLRINKEQVTGGESLRCMIGHVQVVLEIINLHIDLVTLGLEFCESAGWFREVQEPIDIVISQDSLETIHELNVRLVGMESPSVEL